MQCLLIFGKKATSNLSLLREGQKIILRNNFSYSKKHNDKVALLAKIYYLCTMITKEQVEKFLEDFSLKVKIFGIRFRDDRQKNQNESDGQ